MAGQLHCRVIKIDRTSEAALQATARSNQPFVPGTHLLAWLQVRQKLLNTRKRMEDTLAGVTPDDDEEWYDTAEALAQPLLACYWSLWECGQPPPSLPL